MSSSMRAVRLVAAPGGPVPRVVEVPAPGAPTGTQLLVRVVASSVNGTDLGLVRGGRAFRALSAGRVAPGFDLAGEVVACGPAVTGFTVGDRVMTLLGHGGGAQDPGPGATGHGESLIGSSQRQQGADQRPRPIFPSGGEGVAPLADGHVQK